MWERKRKAKSDHCLSHMSGTSILHLKGFMCLETWTFRAGLPFGGGGGKKQQDVLITFGRGSVLKPVFYDPHVKKASLAEPNVSKICMSQAWSILDERFADNAFWDASVEGHDEAIVIHSRFVPATALQLHSVCLLIFSSSWVFTRQCGGDSSDGDDSGLVKKVLVKTSLGASETLYLKAFWSLKNCFETITKARFARSRG